MRIQIRAFRIKLFTTPIPGFGHGLENSSHITDLFYIFPTDSVAIAPSEIRFVRARQYHELEWNKPLVSCPLKSVWFAPIHSILLRLSHPMCNAQQTASCVSSSIDTY
eukprot:935175_1